ncbi:hypothetical protein [uncultured Paraglaciecola sp.]|uniref:hypothetical protein n=1 Tax=uncultured Paraglaciecola sp. TaxID=1765024 RepID=UPI002616E9E0|nr:hypothetical protein [uncultured Paraglaciecola sp.]
MSDSEKDNNPNKRRREDCTIPDHVSDIDIYRMLFGISSRVETLEKSQLESKSIISLCIKVLLIVFAGFVSIISSLFFNIESIFNVFSMVGLIK